MIVRSLLFEIENENESANLSIADELIDLGQAGKKTTFDYLCNYRLYSYISLYPTSRSL